MFVIEVKIMRDDGLHARAAAELVDMLSNVKSEVFIINSGVKINAKSIIGVLSMGIESGDEIKLQVDGVDEDLVVDIVKSFLEQ